MGAHEVGMLQALLERDITPEVVVGTSVGALNGAAVAAEPTLEMVDRLRSLWETLDVNTIFGSSIASGAAQLFRRRTHLHTNDALRRMIVDLLPERFEDLAVPFHCVAACIERAAEHWFTAGDLADAILASTAVPGILPPVEIDGEHFIDGGIVNSIPIARAVQLGATELFVLHVGRIDRPLKPPANPLQVGIVAFEVARRHRFAHDMASLPDGVVAHVLPTGQENASSAPGLADLSYRHFKDISARIDRAYRATAELLSSVRP